MHPLVSQHDVLDYISFDDSSISCYDLSGVLLTFTGEISEPHEYQTGYIEHKTDIYNHSIYVPYIFRNTPRPYRDNRPEFSHLDVSSVWWRHFVPYNEHLAAVGYCKVELKVFWPTPDAFSFPINLENRNCFENVCFQLAHHKRLDPKDFLYPKQKEEMIQHMIKGRRWIQADHGTYSLDRFYSFYTALTKDHLLVLSFHPQGHWKPGTEPPENDLKKVFISFWDFMDRLSIIEDKSRQTRSPGIELKGAMLERHLWEQEQAAGESGGAMESSDSSSGW